MYIYTHRLHCQASDCFSFLGTFSKNCENDIGFVMSIYQSAWDSSAHTGRIFMVIDI